MYCTNSCSNISIWLMEFKHYITGIATTNDYFYSTCSCGKVFVRDKWGGINSKNAKEFENKINTHINWYGKLDKE